MGTDQGPVGGTRRLGQGHRVGQPAVSGGGTGSLSYRDAVARSARAKSGVWERVFQHLAADADNEYAMIDSTIVRAHQHSAGAPKKLVRTRRLAARAAD
jgi:transposase